ncbi:hypothetical protein HK098_002525 [Nowakowskiella sp. JEL0407]|nr:hypothetical protein HK098_002525 [Nowakowskiella sp. JEL0407]
MSGYFGAAPIDEKKVYEDIIMRIGSRSDEFYNLLNRVNQQTFSMSELEEQLQKLRAISKDYSEEINKKRVELDELEKKQISKSKLRLFRSNSTLYIDERRKLLQHIRQLESLLKDTQRTENFTLKTKEKYDLDLKQLDAFLEDIFGVVGGDEEFDEGESLNYVVAPQENDAVQKQLDARDELLRVVAEIEAIQSLGELMERAVEENNLAMNLLSNLTRNNDTPSTSSVVGQKFVHIDNTVNKAKRHIGTLLIAIQMFDDYIDQVAEHVTGTRVDQIANVTSQLITFKQKLWFKELTSGMSEQQQRRNEIESLLNLLKQSQADMMNPLLRLGRLQQVAISECLEVAEINYIQTRQRVTNLRTELIQTAIIYSQTEDYRQRKIRALQELKTQTNQNELNKEQLWLMEQRRQRRAAVSSWMTIEDSSSNSQSHAEKSSDEKSSRAVSNIVPSAFVPIVENFKLIELSDVKSPARTKEFKATAHPVIIYPPDEFVENHEYSNDADDSASATTRNSLSRPQFNKKKARMRTLSRGNRDRPAFSSLNRPTMSSSEGIAFSNDLRIRLRSITMSTMNSGRGVGGGTLSRRSSRSSKMDVLDIYYSMYAEEEKHESEQS